MAKESRRRSEGKEISKRELLHPTPEEAKAQLRIDAEFRLQEGAPYEVRNRDFVEVLGLLITLRSGSNGPARQCIELAELAVLAAQMADADNQQLLTRAVAASKALKGIPSEKEQGKRRQLACSAFLQVADDNQKADGWDTCEAIQRALTRHLPFELTIERWGTEDYRVAKDAVDEWRAKKPTRFAAVNALLRIWGLNHSSDERKGGVKGQGAHHALEHDFKRQRAS